MTELQTAFLGTPDIAVPALRLLAKRTQVRVVITQPDRPAGRGNKLQAPAVKVAAEQLGLPVWQPERLRDHVADARLAGIDLFIVMAFGEIFPKAVLDLPRLGCVNLHASLLPRWRGASPLQAAIRAGDTQSGVTVMRLAVGVDAGPVFNREIVPIGPRTRLPDLHDAIAEAAARALEAYLDLDEATVPNLQDEFEATHCRKLTTDDGQLDFSHNGVELDRWVRAYTPSPGCWTLAATPDREHPMRLRIHDLEPRPSVKSLTIGEVSVIGGELMVGCGDGAVAVLRLQAPDRAALDAAAFLNGNPAPTQFASPTAATAC